MSLYIFKAFHFVYIALFIKKIRCSEFQTDPSKELCSVLSQPQFSNPCTLANHLPLGLANQEQCLCLTHCYYSYFINCAFGAKTSDRQQAIYRRAGHLLNGPAVLWEIDYIICKKCEKKSEKIDSCKFPTGVVLTCTL